jgi:hypothetical protein
MGSFNILVMNIECEYMQHLCFLSSYFCDLVEEKCHVGPHLYKETARPGCPQGRRGAPAEATGAITAHAERADQESG